MTTVVEGVVGRAIYELEKANSGYLMVIFDQVLTVIIS